MNSDFEQLLALSQEVACGRGCEVFILDDKLVVERSLSNNNVRPLGCKLCLSRDIDQNDMGHPTVSGVALRSSLDITEAEISPEVSCNLWFCPECLTPIQQLLPNFI